jgi:hypothetical protein
MRYETGPRGELPSLENNCQPSQPTPKQHIVGQVDSMVFGFAQTTPAIAETDSNLNCF